MAHISSGWPVETASIWGSTGITGTPSSSSLSGWSAVLRSDAFVDTRHWEAWGAPHRVERDPTTWDETRRISWRKHIENRIYFFYFYFLIILYLNLFNYSICDVLCLRWTAIKITIGMNRSSTQWSIPICPAAGMGVQLRIPYLFPYVHRLCFWWLPVTISMLKIWMQPSK